MTTLHPDECWLCDGEGFVEEPNTGVISECDHPPLEDDDVPDTSGIPADPFDRLVAAADRIMELEAEVGRLQAENRALRDGNAGLSSIQAKCEHTVSLWEAEHGQPRCMDCWALLDDREETV